MFEELGEEAKCSAHAQTCWRSRSFQAFMNKVALLLEQVVILGEQGKKREKRKGTFSYK